MPVLAALPKIIEKSLSIAPKEVYKSRDYVLVYDTEEEIKNIEEGIILMGADGKPLLTDRQLEKAKEIAESEIDLQVDNELKTVAPSVSRDTYKSAAQLTGDEKNVLSHRGKALACLLETFKANPGLLK
mgnify:CR=1 FL=1